MAIAGCKSGTVDSLSGAVDLRVKPAAQALPSSWYIDPTNSTGCARDTNNCTSATCDNGGSGPCLTYGQIVRRWGSACPTITSNVTITFLSSQADDSDPVVVCVESTKDVYLEVKAALPTTCTAALSSVTSKNRATGQLLQAQAGACFTGGDLLVTNTTHPSVAWTANVVSGDVSGDVYSLTQPADYNSYTNVDTWTEGDSVVVSEPVKVNIQNVRTPGNVGYPIWIHDLTVWTPVTGGVANIFMQGGLVYMNEVKFQNIGELYTNGIVSFECDNCDFSHNMEINVKPGGEAGNAIVMWGMIRGGFSKLGASIIGGDLLLLADGVPAHQLETTESSAVYVAAGAIVQVLGSSIMVANAGGLPAGPATFWGPGTVQVLTNSQLTYPSPAASAFQVGALKVHTGTTACGIDVTTDPAAWHCNRSLTAANLDTPVADGGLGGCAMGPYSGSICSR